MVNAYQSWGQLLALLHVLYRNSAFWFYANYTLRIEKHISQERRFEYWDQVMLPRFCTCLRIQSKLFLRWTQIVIRLSITSEPTARSMKMVWIGSWEYKTAQKSTRALILIGYWSKTIILCHVSKWFIKDIFTRNMMYISTSREFKQVTKGNIILMGANAMTIDKQMLSFFQKSYISYKAHLKELIYHIKCVSAHVT